MNTRLTWKIFFVKQFRKPKTNQKTILDICDNGGGPTDLKIDEIFKPFSSMGKKGENNSGLGLYITKNILEKNGGEISASVKNNQFKIKIKMKISKIAPAHTPFQTLS